MTLGSFALLFAAVLVLRVLYPCARPGTGDRTVFFTGLSLSMSAMLVLVACGKQPAPRSVDPASDPSSQSASDPESDVDTSQSPSAALPPVDMTGASLSLIHI